MTDLGELLRSAAGPAPVVDGPAIIHNFQRRQRRRRLTAALAVVAVAVIAVPVAQQATSDDPRRIEVVDGPITATTAPAPETTVVSDDVPFDVPAGYEVGETRQRSLADGVTATTWTAYVPGPMDGVETATINVSLLSGDTLLDDERALRGDDATALRHGRETFPDKEPAIEVIGGRRVVAIRDYDIRSGDGLGLPDKHVHFYVLPSDSADGIVQIVSGGADIDDVEAVVATVRL